ncbi:hypothetical protein CMT22_17695 [Elizabethkingia anophelis]|nr:hypothetical protein [Elizabethkingia anophelis]
MSNLLYVRDVSDEERKCLEAFKKMKDEKTDSKAVRYIIKDYFVLHDKIKKLEQQRSEQEAKYRELQRKSDESFIVLKGLKRLLKNLD